MCSVPDPGGKKVTVTAQRRVSLLNTVIKSCVNERLVFYLVYGTSFASDMEIYQV